MRRQNVPTLRSEIVQESDFSDTAYNSGYVSDVHVQGLIANSTLSQFLGTNFLTQDRNAW